MVCYEINVMYRNLRLTANAQRFSYLCGIIYIYTNNECTYAPLMCDDQALFSFFLQPRLKVLPFYSYSSVHHLYELSPFTLDTIYSTHGRIY